ncbi:hypothetical protein ACROYT_G033286 [Oculina patagonica]
MYSYHKKSFTAYSIVQMVLIVLALSMKTWCLPLNSLSARQHHKERRSVASPNQGPPPECYLKYFLHQSPPQELLVDNPSSKRFICQSVPDSPNADFFATLFDDEQGIAILSAYTVSYAQAQGMGKYPRQTVSNSWRTNKELSRQGSNKIYSGKGTGPQGFDKGHLNAAHINSFDKQHVLATFTYSNAVPQYGHFNRGAWSSFEDKIVDYVTSQCAGQYGSSAVMYLLTGTSKFRLQVGGEKPAHDKGPFEIHYFPSEDAEDRIVRPNSMWTAGCCVWNDESGKVRAQSIAVMGNNDFHEERIGMRSMKLEELEKLLVDERSQPVALFPSVAECRSNSHLLNIMVIRVLDFFFWFFKL